MTDSDIAAHSQAHVIECALKQIRLSEGEPLSIGSLSEAAGVTPPVLNKAFHSYFGVNVNGFLRLRNLRAVRAALIKADPLQDTVSAVVHRCGMANTDRFEDNYRRLFGESPARTLQLSAEHAARRDMSWLACAAQIFLADALLPGSLLQSAVVTPRCPTSEGVLVEAVAIPWLELVAQLELRPTAVSSDPLANLGGDRRWRLRPTGLRSHVDASE